MRNRLEVEQATNLGEGDYVVLDPRTGNARFYANPSEAQRAAEGKNVPALATTRVKPDYIPKMLRDAEGRGTADFGTTDPALVPKTEAARRVVERIQETLDNDRSANFRDRSAFQPYLSELSEREQLDALPGLLALAAQDDRVSVHAAENAMQKGARSKARDKGGELFTDYYRVPDQRTVNEWAERGIVYRSPAQFWEDVKAYEKRQKRDDAGAAKVASEAHKGLKKTDVRSLSDLANQDGFGERAVASLERAGITLADLRAGRVSEDKLAELKGWGDTKVRKLRDLGFVVPESTSSKRPVGRPRKETYTFGKGADPFNGSNSKPALIGSRRVDVRDGNNNIVQRRVKSRFAEFRERFSDSFRSTVGAPFAFVRSFTDTEERRAVRDANKLVGIKRAVAYRTRAEAAKTGFGAGMEKVKYYFVTALVQTLVWAAVLSPFLFLPIGILHVAGWALFGLGAFIIHQVLLLGLTGVNLIASSVIGGLNTLGFLTQNSLQGLLDQVPSVLPGGGGTLSAYKPVELPLQLTQVLNPNAFFPDCTNTNTLGAIGLDLLAGLSRSFAQFLVENGSLAVGMAIILLLGIPAYFVSKGTSVALIVAGVIVMALPVLSDFTLPMWVLVGIVLLIIAGVFAAFTLSADLGIAGPILGVGGLLVAVIVSAMVTQTIDLGALNFKADIHVGTKPVAVMLGNGIHSLAGGMEFLSSQITTGWNKALDANHFVGLRDAFNVGETELPPPTGCVAPGV